MLQVPDNHGGKRIYNLLSLNPTYLSRPHILLEQVNLIKF
jgi:hypothetical protein